LLRTENVKTEEDIRGTSVFFLFLFGSAYCIMFE